MSTRSITVSTYAGWAPLWNRTNEVTVRAALLGAYRETRWPARGADTAVAVALYAAESVARRAHRLQGITADDATLLETSRGWTTYGVTLGWPDARRAGAYLVVGMADDDVAALHASLTEGGAS